MHNFIFESVLYKGKVLYQPHTVPNPCLIISSQAKTKKRRIEYRIIKYWYWMNKLSWIDSVAQWFRIGLWIWRSWVRILLVTLYIILKNLFEKIQNKVRYHQQDSNPGPSDPQANPKPLSYRINSCEGILSIPIYNYSIFNSSFLVLAWDKIIRHGSGTVWGWYRTLPLYKILSKIKLCKKFFWGYTGIWTGHCVRLVQTHT